jgi:hypothetical protein
VVEVGCVCVWKSENIDGGMVSAKKRARSVGYWLGGDGEDGGVDNDSCE